MLTLTCLVVGDGSVVGVKLDDKELVSILKNVIWNKKKKFQSYDEDELTLYLAKKNGNINGEWMQMGDPDINELSKTNVSKEIRDRYLNEAMEMKIPNEVLSEYIKDVGKKTREIHILVKLPVEEALMKTAEKQGINYILNSEINCIFLGVRDSWVSYEGINIKSSKILHRSDVTTAIIKQLENKKVILIKSPPMTGKTSMATLIAHELEEKYTKSIPKALILNFSMAQFAGTSSNFNFEYEFEAMFKFSWSELNRISERRLIFLIIDEAQRVYKRNGSNGDKNSPLNKSRVLWDKIKSALASSGTSRIFFLLFAAYGSSIENLELLTPVTFQRGETSFGIEKLTWNHKDVRDYVQKNFNGIEVFQYEDSAFDQFCLNLEHITGSHAGLCSTCIQSLNVQLLSSKYTTPSPMKLIEWLYNKFTYRSLSDTRAVKILNKIFICGIPQSSCIELHLPSSF